MTDDLYGTETLESLVEEFEDEFEESDYDDMIERRGRRPRPRTASGRNLSTARPQGGAVTQAQLATAMAKVSEQIQTNSRAISTLTTRVEAVSAEQAKQLAAMRKEITQRKRHDDAQKKDFQQKLQWLLLLPLLIEPKSEQIKVSDANGDSKTIDVLVKEDDAFKTLLPVLLIGGGLGGSGSDGGTDTTMPLLLALTLGNRD